MGSRIQSKIEAIRDDIRLLRMPEAQPGVKNVLALMDRLAEEVEAVKRAGMRLNYRLNHFPWDKGNEGSKRKR